MDPWNFTQTYTKDTTFYAKWKVFTPSGTCGKSLSWSFDKATGTDDKELCLIEGASHIRTYWVKEYVNKAVSKLDTFFKDNL